MRRNVIKLHSLSSRRVDIQCGQLKLTPPSVSSLYVVHNACLWERYYTLYPFSFVEYVVSLLDEVTRVCLAEDLSQSKALQIPPSLCSNYERPSRMDAIREHRTRFNT